MKERPSIKKSTTAVCHAGAMLESGDPVAGTAERAADLRILGSGSVKASQGVLFRVYDKEMANS